MSQGSESLPSNRYRCRTDNGGIGSCRAVTGAKAQDQLCHVLEGGVSRKWAQVYSMVGMC